MYGRAWKLIVKTETAALQRLKCSGRSAKEQQEAITTEQVLIELFIGVCPRLFNRCRAQLVLKFDEVLRLAHGAPNAIEIHWPIEKDSGRLSRELLVAEAAVNFKRHSGA
jgi:hypothetical protein